MVKVMKGPAGLYKVEPMDNIQRQMPARVSFVKEQAKKDALEVARILRVPEERIVWMEDYYDKNGKYTTRVYDPDNPTQFEPQGLFHKICRLLTKEW